MITTDFTHTRFDIKRMNHGHWRVSSSLLPCHQSLQQLLISPPPRLDWDRRDLTFACACVPNPVLAAHASPASSCTSHDILRRSVRSPRFRFDRRKQDVAQLEESPMPHSVSFFLGLSGPSGSLLRANATSTFFSPQHWSKWIKRCSSKD